MKNCFSFFKNHECEHFPCHNVSNTEDFNCLFCYCPLYADKNCGGNFTLLENGIKDCSNCLIPHNPKNYDLIISKLQNKEP
jgi:Zn-finger protein